MASAAVTVVTLDLYGINVALPTIGRDLDLDHTTSSAVIVAYSLSLTALLVPIGRLGDRFGRRRLLVAGLAAFGLLSLACSQAASGAVLLLARTGQGAAAAAVSATSLSLVTVAVRRERQAFALGLWTAITAAGSTLGPPLAGFVVGQWSWRWFFGLNAPLSLLFALGVLATVGESKMADHPAPDRRGTVALVLGLSLVVGGISVVASPDLPTVLPFVAAFAGVAVLVWFVRVERAAASPLFDLSILRDRSYAATSAVAFGANWAYGALILYTPIYLQESIGESPERAGVTMLAFTVLYAAWSPAVGRIEAGRRASGLLLAGLALIASGLAVLAFPDASTLWLVSLALVLSALGQGLAFNTSGTVAMAAMGPDRAGVAAGVLSTVRQGGSTFGLAVAGSTYAAVLARGGTHDDAFNWVMGTTVVVVLVTMIAVPFLGSTRVAPAIDGGADPG